ncbi:MAG: hypothetical protein ACSHXY_05745 [Alphaproteobacteria bacterium]
MTYFDNTPEQNLARPDTEILPPLKAPSLAGVLALRAMIPCLMTWLRAHIGQRGAKGIARNVQVSLRRLHKKEKAAMAAVIKKALRSSSEWRARVFEDLGGLPALARWEARLLRAHTPPPEDDYSWLDDDPADWPMIEAAAPRKPISPSAQARDNKGPRLDRDGLFKWAAIPQGKHERSAREPSPYEGRCAERADHFLNARRAHRSFTNPWPIEVSPSDLLDPFEPEEIIILTQTPAALWDAHMLEPEKWQSEMTVIGHRIWPETRPACLVPS